MIKYRKYLLKLKDAFLEENAQNTKMLDLYLKYLEGEASEQDLENANKQLAEILKSLGMGILVVLPFSPVSIPYLVKKAKENNIDIRVVEKKLSNEALWNQLIYEKFNTKIKGAIWNNCRTFRPYTR